MNAAQMLHQRTKAGLQQTIADTTKKRTAKQRAALQARLDEVIAYERANPELVVKLLRCGNCGTTMDAAEAVAHDRSCGAMRGQVPAFTNA